ncbi:hypothetical protein DWU98_01360 [Dyella monticola]|uniref:Uncharacterized protein n=1 Tax=Dyella monticola TaxID=1927958 RepID=A0A370X898_9GAMM|nr:hypothetical protein DWU98_01360 [Dyella monticola]
MHQAAVKARRFLPVRFTRARVLRPDSSWCAASLSAGSSLSTAASLSTARTCHYLGRHSTLHAPLGTDMAWTPECPHRFACLGIQDAPRRGMRIKVAHLIDVPIDIDEMILASVLVYMRVHAVTIGSQSIQATSVHPVSGQIRATWFVCTG